MSEPGPPDVSGPAHTPPVGLAPAYPIRTERLDLRPHRSSDLEDLLVFHSSPEVTRFTPWPVRTREQTRVALAAKLEQGALTAPGQWLVLAMELRSSGHVIGEALLKWTSDHHRQGEVGVALASAHHRQGLGSEAVRAMLELGFGPLGLHRITAELIAANRASAGVLAALGLRHEGTFRDAVRFEGGWADEELWALTAPEWQAQARR